MSSLEDHLANHPVFNSSIAFHNLWSSTHEAVRWNPLDEKHTSLLDFGTFSWKPAVMKKVRGGPNRWLVMASKSCIHWNTIQLIAFGVRKFKAEANLCVFVTNLCGQALVRRFEPSSWSLQRLKLSLTILWILVSTVNKSGKPIGAWRLFVKSFDSSHRTNSDKPEAN